MKRIALLVGMVLCLANQAGAAVLDTWTRISLQFSNLSRAAATDTGIGVTTISTSGGGAHLNTITLGGIPGLSINTILPVTDPIVSNGGIVSIRLTKVRGAIDVAGPQNNPGVLNPISGAIRSTTTPAGGLGTVPSTGMVRLCLLAVGCAANLPLVVGKTINGVAQGGGVGGLLTIGQLGTIRVSIVGAPYTVKTVTAFNRTNNGAIQTFTDKGFAHGPLSNTSSTGQTSGVLQVISASHTTVVGVPGNSDISGLFSRVLVHFVPEPDLLLMLGSGAVALAWLGHRRLRR